jgi:hypothetical protein
MLGVASALHYLGIRKDTVMNIKALVASLVLGVVATSSAAMASPNDGRRGGHDSRPVLVGRPGIGRPVHVERGGERGFDRGFNRGFERGFDRGEGRERFDHNRFERDRFEHDRFGHDRFWAGREWSRR